MRRSFGSPERRAGSASLVRPSSSWRPVPRFVAAVGAGAGSRSGGLRAGLAALVLAAAGAGVGPGSALAYRFYDNGITTDYIVPSSKAIRWSADAWGPGRPLEWEIEEGSDWALLLDHSAADFVPPVAEALSLWSDIPTADISWRLSGVAEPGEGSRFGDSRNSVFFEPASDIAGAAIWWVRNQASGAWEITECDIGIPDGIRDWLEDGADAEDLRGWTKDTVLWWSGHCLGLGRAAEFPSPPYLRYPRSGDRIRFGGTDVWKPRPAMGGWDSLAHDDRTGASLLRPLAGWKSRVGAISGVLESDGTPVPYAHVYALRQTATGLRDPVGAFANARGEFLIEGLPPGDYLLWAHPIRYYGSHRPLIFSGAATDVRDAVRAQPVPVNARGVTEGIRIAMRRGRK